MRPYRGLTIETKRWAYGWYCKVDGKHYIILDEAEFHRAAETSDGCIEDMISGFVEVVPETVGPQTGLKDNTKWRSLTYEERDAWINTGNTSDNWNGKEIYEGDISADRCVVHIGKFITGDDYGTPAFGVYKTDGTSTWGLDPNFPETIIDNIHDNPKLLEEKK